ncbi:Catabolic 3-dehydroquinase [Streptomyces alboniger]
MPRTLANAPIMILNGPNLNLLGQRQPEIYGSDTLADVEALCVKAAAAHGGTVDFRQSNHEGELVELDPNARARLNHCGIVINPAAYSHTSVAILDALNTCDGLPVVEVHISNIHQREPFRHHSYVSQRADGVVAGCGVQGYVFGGGADRGPGRSGLGQGLRRRGRRPGGDREAGGPCRPGAVVPVRGCHPVDRAAPVRGERARLRVCERFTRGAYTGATARARGRGARPSPAARPPFRQA